MLCALLETFIYFHQIPNLKNIKVWTKLDNFFFHNIFIRLLTFFFVPHLPYITYDDDDFNWTFWTLTTALWVCLCMAGDIPSRSHMMMMMIMMSRSDLQGRETNFTVHCSQCSWHMIASWWKRSIFSLQWFL